VTRLGSTALVCALILGVAGFELHWASFEVMCAIGLLIELASFLITRPVSALDIQRSLHPQKVTKGSASIALLSIQNTKAKSSARVDVVQSIGEAELFATLPSLLSKQRLTKSISLPTKHRGHFDVGQVTIRRSDPFGLFTQEKKFGVVEQLWVQPSITPLRSHSRGSRKDIEGPTSDSSPMGNVAFHRIREYIAGDDPRLIDWKATARKSASTLELMVRHNVDVTQPGTIVLLDITRERFSHGSFETVVDIAASIVRSTLVSGGNLNLITTDDDDISLGNSSVRDDAAILDFLTDVKTSEHGNLISKMRTVGTSTRGLTLIVVTSNPTADEVATADSLVGRFSKVIIAAQSSAEIKNPFPRLSLVHGEDLSEFSDRWNSEMR